MSTVHVTIRRKQIESFLMDSPNRHIYPGDMRERRTYKFDMDDYRIQQMIEELPAEIRKGGYSALKAATQWMRYVHLPKTGMDENWEIDDQLMMLMMDELVPRIRKHRWCGCIHCYPRGYE